MNFEVRQCNDMSARTVMFDAGVIEGLKGNEDKIRCILNKADQVRAVGLTD